LARLGSPCASPIWQSNPAGCRRPGGDIVEKLRELARKIDKDRRP
jgi:hypothetical protein